MDEIFILFAARVATDSIKMWRHHVTKTSSVFVIECWHLSDGCCVSFQNANLQKFWELCDSTSVWYFAQ